MDTFLTKDQSVCLLKTITVVRPKLLSERIKGPHGILAMGAPRGGTSTISYLLDRAGIDMGRINHQNYEDNDVQKSIGNRALLNSVLQRRSKAAGDGRWGCKVPALSFHLQWLDTVLTAPVFVFVFRNPAAVARSILNRDPVFGSDQHGYLASIDHGMKFYNSFRKLAPRLSAPIIVYEYEEAKRRPEIFVTEMDCSLGLGLNSEKIQEIAASITAPGYKIKHN